MKKEIPNNIKNVLGLKFHFKSAPVFIETTKLIVKNNDQIKNAKTIRFKSISERVVNKLIIGLLCNLFTAKSKKNNNMINGIN
jgi:hypothetical protein